MTKEEMQERFRLFGELFCLCYELAEGDCNCDIEGFKVDFDTDICDVLDLDPDDDALRLDCGQDDEPDEVSFEGIEVNDGDMVMLGFQGVNNNAELLEYDHTRLVLAAFVCHLTGFEVIDRAIGGVYEMTMNKTKELS